MHQHNTAQKSHKKLLVIYLAVVLGLLFIFRKEIQNIAPIFQLTPEELKMIPIGALLFVIFWQISERFLFGPYIDLFKAREAATTGSLEESKNYHQQAEAIHQDVAAKMYAARSNLAKEREQILAEAKAKCDAEITKTNADIQVKISEERSKNLAEITRLKKSLDTQVDELTRDVVERIKAAPAGNIRGIQ